MTKTPKILWQTWKTKDNIPVHLQKYVKEWKDLHKTYEYHLLDDEDLLSLIGEIVPQYLDDYKNFSKPIERVDFARYALLYKNGGIYADMDTRPHRKMDRWVNENKIVLGCEPEEHAKNIYNRNRIVCNALMISPRGEKFWLDLMKYIIDNYEKNYRPVENTGPLAITNFLETSVGKKYEGSIIITDPCIFYPILNDGSVSKKCNIKESYAEHVWGNSWVVPWYRDSMWFNARYWLYFTLSMFLIIWLWCYIRK